MKHHHYQSTIEWLGNEGEGTKTYKSYNRNHRILINDKYEEIYGSADPAFLGDNSKYNPEDLFLSSLSACHMLWYLHLCAVNKVVVISYRDNATGIMEENQDGSGRFVSVTLNPTITVTDKSMIAKAHELHKEANKMCFIANSCNFSVEHNAIIKVNAQ